jgi:hypothetical protein
MNSLQHQVPAQEASDAANATLLLLLQLVEILV